VIAVRVTAATLHALHDELGVLLLCHAGQLADEGNRRPQLIVTVVCPGRHAGHLDTVLEDPEQFAIAVGARGHGEIRRLRIEPLGDVALGHAGRTVADGAMSREMLGAHRDPGRIIESGWCSDPGRMRLDRAHPRRLNHPVRDPPMGRGGADVIEAGIDEDRAADQDEGNSDGEGGEDGAHDHPRSEPDPQAGDEAHAAGALARAPREVRRLAEFPLVDDAEIGCEFPAELVAQAQAGIGIGKAGAAGQRAERFISSEAAQLSGDAPGLIMVEMTNTKTGFKSWEPLIKRRFQPTIQTRVGGVCLFSSGILLTSTGFAVPSQTKLLLNPHATLPLPSWINTTLEAGIRRLGAQAIRENSLVEQWDIPALHAE
jgi:hypothetical protein